MIEADKEKLKLLYRHLLKNMKAISHELNAYRAAAKAMKALSPDLPLEDALNFYRKAPEILALTDAMFAEMEGHIERLDEVEQNQELSRLLQNWRPEEEPN